MAAGSGNLRVGPTAQPAMRCRFMVACATFCSRHIAAALSYFFLGKCVPNKLFPRAFCRFGYENDTLATAHVSYNILDNMYILLFYQYMYIYAHISCKTIFFF